MEEKKTAQVIKFPIENRRADVSNIAVDSQEIIEKIELMKKHYFSEVAEHILDDVLRSIDAIELDYSKFETFDMTSNDHIMIKESVIAAMCRIVGIEHPLHRIGDVELIPNIIIETDESTSYTYKFRSEDDKVAAEEA